MFFAFHCLILCPDSHLAVTPLVSMVACEVIKTDGMHGENVRVHPCLDHCLCFSLSVSPPWDYSFGWKCRLPSLCFRSPSFPFLITKLGHVQGSVSHIQRGVFWMLEPVTAYHLALLWCVAERVSAPLHWFHHEAQVQLSECQQLQRPEITVTFKLYRVLNLQKETYLWNHLSAWDMKGWNCDVEA